MAVKIDLGELTRLARNATPGNWTTTKPGVDADGWPTATMLAATGRDQGVYTDHKGGVAPEADRAHIAANGPLVTLALIARIRELEAGLAELVDELVQGSEDPDGDYGDARALVAKGVVLT